MGIVAFGSNGTLLRVGTTGFHDLLCGQYYSKMYGYAQYIASVSKRVFDYLVCLSMCDWTRTAYFTFVLYSSVSAQAFSSPMKTSIYTPTHLLLQHYGSEGTDPFVPLFEIDDHKLSCSLKA